MENQTTTNCNPEKSSCTFVLHVPAPHLELLSVLAAPNDVARDLLTRKNAVANAKQPTASQRRGEQHCVTGDGESITPRPAEAAAEAAHRTWRIDVVDSSFYESSVPHFDTVSPPILPPSETDDVKGFDYQSTATSELEPETGQDALTHQVSDPYLHEEVVNDCFPAEKVDDRQTQFNSEAKDSTSSGTTNTEIDHVAERLEQIAAQAMAQRQQQATVDTNESNALRLAAQRSQVFTPHWEVDHFEWPATCQRLALEMGQGLGKLCDTLRALAGQGRKVLLITSHGRREGVTSLSLCIAHQLASSTERTMLMDANLLNPDAARQLGVRTKAGIERGNLDATACEEVAISSLDDHFTLLPLRRALGRSATDTNIDHPTASINELLPHADFLLVDLGPIRSAKVALQTLGTNAKMCSAIIVQDVRHTTDDQAYTAQREMADLGIESLGVVQNFTSPLPAARANSA